MCATSRMSLHPTPPTHPNPTCYVASNMCATSTMSLHLTPPTHPTPPTWQAWRKMHWSHRLQWAKHVRKRVVTSDWSLFSKGDKLTLCILVDEWMTLNLMIFSGGSMKEIWWFSWILVDQWKNLVHNLPTTLKLNMEPEKMARKRNRIVYIVPSWLWGANWAGQCWLQQVGFCSRDSCLTRNLVRHYGSMGLVQLPTCNINIQPST